MGRIVKPNQICPVHGGNSLQIYEDGSGHCFNNTCEKHWKPGSFDTVTGELLNTTTKSPYVVYEESDNKPKKKKTSVEPNLVKQIRESYETAKYKYRDVSEEVIKFYRCLISYNQDGTQRAIYYGYNLDEDLKPQAYKKRVLPKDFTEGSVGKMAKTFGSGLFSGGKRIILTEGEDDCLIIQEAYYRKYGRMYPVQSLRSASSTSDLIEEREEFRKFDEIILWLDSDGPGQKAIKESAKILGYDKCKVVKCPYKDAGEVKEKQGYAKVLSYVYDAVEYSPAAILNGRDLWERVVSYNEKPCVPYPPFMEDLNQKLGGMRFGEITLWTSGTGSGKSTLMREIIYWLSQLATLIREQGTEEGYKNTDAHKRLVELVPSMEDYDWSSGVPRIGVVSLEESPEETARKLSGMAINRNPAAEDIPMEDLKVGFDEVFGSGDLMVLDHQGSIDDGSVMDHLEYMCLKGCKFLFVDHITILVSEGADGLTGNEAIDKVMNDMLRLVKKYDVWLGLISHLRKSPNDKKSFEEGKIPSLDDIKGSGSIKQIAFDVIGFARDQSSDIEDTRNTVNTKVLKCRYTGKTGPSGSFHYDFDSGRLTKASDEFSKGGKFETV